MTHTLSQEETISIDVVEIKRALISVSDKTGLLELSKALIEHGVEIFSTGGTETHLRDHGIPVRSVSDLTQSPEVFDGRLKTLHPIVHGGLLYRRSLPSHIAQAEEHNIGAIDLLVVNLYPFEETLRKPGATRQEIIEQIDIGGPAMLRSAAKNYEGVALLTNPSQYPSFIEELKAKDGSTSLDLRFSLAKAAFENVAKYDRAIADYFNSTAGSNGHGALPEALNIALPLAQPLRYGENPQQRAALYGSAFSSICKQLWGKELSYNNILDTSAALGLIAEFRGNKNPVVAIVKHTNPCGVAEGKTPIDAFNRAFSTDPESPFGGIIAVNTTLDAELALRLNAFFSEVILAPKFTDEALEILKKKKDRRLLQFDADRLQSEIGSMMEVRSVIGGVLFQDSDRDDSKMEDMKSVTSRKLESDDKRGLAFSWIIGKHLKSNAIAYCGIENGYARTLGLGAGQTSRVESSRLAVERAKHHGLSLTGSYVASDAFFPFADGLIAAADAGAIAAIEPGGSVRDAEVIEAAEKHGISLVMTGVRHFKH